MFKCSKILIALIILSFINIAYSNAILVPFHLKSPLPLKSKLKVGIFNGKYQQPAIVGRGLMYYASETDLEGFNLIYERNFSKNFCLSASLIVADGDYQVKGKTVASSEHFVINWPLAFISLGLRGKFFYTFENKIKPYILVGLHYNTLEWEIRQGRVLTDDDGHLSYGVGIEAELKYNMTLSLEYNFLGKTNDDEKLSGLSFLVGVKF